MNCKECAQDLYGMMGQGQMLEAFEKYYHDDVVMVEGTGEVRKGKDTNRKFEQEWLAGLQEMHGGGVNAITADEENNVTMVESWMDCTFKNGGRVKMEEVAVQKWQDGKVIHERFYYNAPTQ